MRSSLKKVAGGNWKIESGFTPGQREKLEAFAKILTEWNQKINLVSATTIEELWQRHIEDSAQIAGFLPESSAIYDVGSGAGLPGLVLSILGHGLHLVESDMKKAIFLAEAARVCGVKPAIHNKRVEQLEAQAEVIVARAFASLSDIFTLTKNISTPTTKFVLLKGENVASEILEAQRGWHFVPALHPSRTGPGYVLIVKQLSEKTQPKETGI